MGRSLGIDAHTAGPGLLQVMRFSFLEIIGFPAPSAGIVEGVEQIVDVQYPADWRIGEQAF